MTPPTCEYCGRPFADPRGCDYSGGDLKLAPVRYGEERYPLSSSPTCRDCGAPKGTYHHASCYCSECPKCHGQYAGCYGIDCQSAGGTADAA